LSLLSLNGIKKSWGAREILRGVSFTLSPGEKTGLIGRNGSGKTTLLDIISGRSAPDSGEMAFARGTKVGYLEQEAVYSEGNTLIEEMLSARPDVLDLKHKLKAAADNLSAAASSGIEYDKALEDYGHIQEEFEKSGGYAYDSLVTGALAGLGFDKDEFNRQISTLSGGQRTRLYLAKILLAQNDLLMLDEPTNHLDVPAILWLEEFLKSYPGAVLLVSHDRYFLDRVVSRIIEIEDGQAEEYNGGFTAYRIEKDKRLADRQRHYDLMAARLEKEKEYINRMRAGVHARQAKGREKRLARFDMPSKPLGDARSLSFEWGEVKRSADTVVNADGVSKSFGAKKVLKDINFTVRRGERAGIIGRNGGGKSTLLKIILGETAPDSGGIFISPNVKAAYYAQGLEGLDETNTVLDEIWAAKPLAPEQEMRDLLGSFLFSGDNVQKKVGDLSGGEKGRLALAKTILAGANLLVLDEPTNHLDIPSREALEEALKSFGGTVLAVSHDRYFLDSFSEKTYELSGGGLTEYWGNYSYTLEKKLQAAEESREPESEGRAAWEDRKQKQALEKRKEKDIKLKERRIAELEREIEGLEDELKAAEEKLASPEVYEDFNQVSDITRWYNELKTKRDGLYDLLEKEVS
jgi:ATP-binding cassette subfamily F protein 3